VTVAAGPGLRPAGLVSVKTTYDRDNLYRHDQIIPPRRS
jgi:hypothetical protein